MHTMAVKTVDVRYAPGIEGPMLGTPETAAAFLTSWYLDYDSDQEIFGMLVLDGRHCLIGVKALSIGNHVAAPVDRQKLFKVALELDARGLIVFHNHPSGEMSASREDIELTQALIGGGKLLGIPVHDHIVMIPNGRSVSLRTARADLFA